MSDIKFQSYHTVSNYISDVYLPNISDSLFQSHLSQGVAYKSLTIVILILVSPIRLTPTFITIIEGMVISHVRGTTILRYNMKLIRIQIESGFNFPCPTIDIGMITLSDANDLLLFIAKCPSLLIGMNIK